GSICFGTFPLQPTGARPKPPTNPTPPSSDLQTVPQPTTGLAVDNNDGPAARTVTITIPGTNEVPVIGGVSTGDVTEDINVVAGNIFTSGALTIADVDAGQSNFTAQASTDRKSVVEAITVAASGGWTIKGNNRLPATQQPH